MPAEHPNSRLIVRKLAGDRAIVPRVVRSAAKGAPQYWVRSAMILKEGPLAQKVAAVRRRGGTPEMVVLSSSCATLLHPAPHGAFRQDREENVGEEGEKNKDRRYSVTERGALTRSRLRHGPRPATGRSPTSCWAACMTSSGIASRRWASCRASAST